MNEEEKALLREATELSRENNKMLRAMHRSVRVGFWVHSIKWIIIILSLVWSFSLIQPYLTQLQEIYSGITGTQQSMADLQGKLSIDPEEIENFLKSFNVGN